MCNCDSCKMSRRIRRTMLNGSHQQKNKLINELANLYWHTDADLEYENAVASGDWPQSVEILESRLEIAKAKREKEGL